tara:strand:+ start:207 stop:923 length:717 start_codon:yes stop_codon:yes gene_type:complete
MDRTAEHLLKGEMDFNGKSTANTSSNGYNHSGLGQKLVQNDKFRRSGKNNPCPICDRTKDDKCAWNDSVINCYNGVSNYPPQDLKIGETFLMDIGSMPKGKWALVATNKGFSGNHHIFIPDKPRKYEKKLKIEKISINKLNKLFNLLSEEVTEALRLDPMFLTLEQLEEVSKKTDEALERTNIVLRLAKKFPQKELTYNIQLGNLFETTKSYFHKLKNRQEQIRQFRAEQLGEINGNF